MPYTGGPAISTVNISRSCAARVDLPIVFAPRLFPSTFGSGNQWTKQRLRHAESSLAKIRPSPVTLEMQKIGQAWPSWRNSHTTVVRASAKIKACLSAFEKVLDMTMESTAQKPANSSEFWLVWTSDQSSIQPASCQITCELGLLFEDPRRCGFQLVHLLHHQGLPLHCV